MDGFNLKDPLVCEGIVGDGCGGGRVFFIEDETLKTYDPLTKERMNLLNDLKAVGKISKKGCIITIECAACSIAFDLSKLQKV